MLFLLINDNKTLILVFCWLFSFLPASLVANSMLEDQSSKFELRDAVAVWFVLTALGPVTWVWFALWALYRCVRLIVARMSRAW